MNALDFVKPKNDTRIGIIRNLSVDGKRASVTWIGGNKGYKISWYDSEELEIIDNLSDLLVREFDRISH